MIADHNDRLRHHTKNIHHGRGTVEHYDASTSLISDNRDPSPSFVCTVSLIFFYRLKKKTKKVAKHTCDDEGKEDVWLVIGNAKTGGPKVVDISR
jgi:hypothetical protein